MKPHVITFHDPAEAALWRKGDRLCGTGSGIVVRVLPDKGEVHVAAETWWRVRYWAARSWCAQAWWAVRMRVKWWLYATWCWWRGIDQ